LFIMGVVQEIQLGLGLTIEDRCPKPLHVAESPFVAALLLLFAHSCSKRERGGVSH
jgi:hypothetical protein